MRNKVLMWAVMALIAVALSFPPPSLLGQGQPSAGAEKVDKKEEGKKKKKRATKPAKKKTEKSEKEENKVQ